MCSIVNLKKQANIMVQRYQKCSRCTYLNDFNFNDVTDRSKAALLIFIFMLRVLSVCLSVVLVDLLWLSCCFSYWALV